MSWTCRLSLTRQKLVSLTRQPSSMRQTYNFEAGNLHMNNLYGTLVQIMRQWCCLPVRKESEELRQRDGARRRRKYYRSYRMSCGANLESANVEF